METQKCEVIEKSTGCKMSRGFPAGTVFDSSELATQWMEEKQLTNSTHRIAPVKVGEK